ncbi:3485_t:CDS:2, partial [Funneliformis geosporum]
SPVSGKTKKDKAQFKKYLERIEDPNYQGGSWALPENPTTSEKTKYELCEKVIKYKRNHKFTTEKLAQKMQLSKAETEDILYCRIDYLTLDRLLSYTDKLFAPAQVEIIIKELKPRKRTITKITITDYYQTKPGRKMITHELIVELVKTLDGRQVEPEPKKNPHDREVFNSALIIETMTRKGKIKTVPKGGFGKGSSRITSGQFTNAEQIKNQFFAHASCQRAGKESGDGGEHYLSKDSQALADFANGIANIGDEKQNLTLAVNEQEFNNKKQQLVNKLQECINGLKLKFQTDLNQLQTITPKHQKQILELEAEIKSIEAKYKENMTNAAKETDPAKKAKFIAAAQVAETELKKVKQKLRNNPLTKLIQYNHLLNYTDDLEKLFKGNVPKQPPTVPETPSNPNDSVDPSEGTNPTGGQTP